MRSRHATSFGQGLAAGFGASLAGLALLVVLTGDNGPVVEAAVEWTARNLGLAAAVVDGVVTQLVITQVPYVHVWEPGE